MNPKICVSIVGRTFKEIEEMTKQAESEGAALIEIRFDYLSDRSKPEDIRNLTSLPLIACNRLPSQGGLFHGKEENRQDKLLAALDAGFNLIDIEIETPGLEKIISPLRRGKARSILSWHSFSPPILQELELKFSEMTSHRPDICKLVTTAGAIEDNLTCLNFLSKISRTTESICFCMGSLGVISRVLSPFFGGVFTYASIMRGKEAAPGQPTLAEARQIYNLLGV
jgi:3-dehydroquinate dehydratase/shikimate dehydrogenase